MTWSVRRPLDGAPPLGEIGILADSSGRVGTSTSTSAYSFVGPDPRGAERFRQSITQRLAVLRTL